MKNIYFKKVLMGLMVLCGCNAAMAQSVNDIAGKYSDGENTVTVRVTDAENGGVNLSGLVGKPCNVAGTYADGKITIDLSKGVYVDMGMSLQEGSLAAMQMLLLAGEDGSVNMMTGLGQVVISVADGKLTTTQNLCAGVLSFMTGTITPVAYMEPCTLSKVEVPALTAEQICGTYNFTANASEISETYGTLMGENFKADNFTLTITTAGEDKYMVSGICGYSTPVEAEYCAATGQLILYTNPQDNGGEYVQIATSTDGAPILLSTLFTVTYLDMTADGLSTNNTLGISYEETEDSEYGSGMAAIIRGGKAVKDATAIKQMTEKTSEAIYNLNGMRTGESTKGIHIIKSAKGTKKVMR